MTTERALLKVVGMYCSNCKPTVEKQLKDEKGVKNIDIHYMTNSVIIDYDPLLITKAREIMIQFCSGGSLIRRRFSTNITTFLDVFARMLFWSS